MEEKRFDSLREMRTVDIRSVKREDLIDLGDIHIKEELSKEERMKEFIRQVKNPYCYKVGNIIIKASYSEGGVSFEERFEDLILSL